MPFLEKETIRCPYCGEKIVILVDIQESGDQYIEDCQVCCRPIVFKVTKSDVGKLVVSAHSENDVF